MVNDNDEVIGQELREKVYSEMRNHRIVHIIVINTQGQIVLQLRSQKVRGFPGFWCTAAAGHVHAGESYFDAAKRELVEEAGIEADLKFVARDQFVWSSAGRDHKKFLSIFVAESEGPFLLNPDEVEKVEFFDPEEILQIAARGEKAHPESFYVLQKFIHDQYAQ